MDPIKTTPGWEREELPFTGIFHLGDQGCEVMGAGMVLEVPPCPSPPREEKKMENPWEIHGKSMGNPWFSVLFSDSVLGLGDLRVL